ncbi:MAG TPA: N-acetyl-alpha-D-glucosaminyl L-malate synthase BshA [candidate division Zixibacteria bacterium]|nr:N-acetyl-alpha-D-glucosaminyl L-malate synthase BshA [candidate division Zixibacteria bacterium]
MKIGIINYPTFGGSGIVGTELGLHLMKKGHEVHFISYQIPERLKLEENFIFHEVNVLSYPLFKYKPYTIVLASLLHKLVNEKGLEILHGHYTIPHSVSLYLAKLSNNKANIISTIHGSDMHLLGLDDAYKPILVNSLNNHNALTTVSHWMKDFVNQNYDINKEIQVIPNFVSPEKFSHIKKPEKEEIVFCHVSNFRKVKRSPDIIRAFAAAVAQNDKLRLEMIGEGPELEYCRDLAISLKIKDKITFRGSLLNVPRVLCYSDVFVIPSEIESFGLAALEAMSCSIPVISSNAGGLPEVVQHEKTGFTINVGDIEALTKYMLLLAEDEKLRKKLGQESQKVARTNFHPDKIIPQYEALYEKVLAK